MNNLRFMREKSNVPAKTIVALLNITVHTYYGIEKDRVVLSPIHKVMLARIYAISEEDICVSRNNISEIAKKTVYTLSCLDEEEQKNILNYNLSGQCISKLTDKNIAQIKNIANNINVSEIYYIECCRKHIIYHTKQSVYETKDTLTSVLHKLEKYGFYQVTKGISLILQEYLNFSKIVL